jgi:lysyl-tRNA synthetase, class II
VALTADRRQWVPRTVQAREQLAAWAGRIVTLAGLWSLVSIPLRPFQWPDWIDDAFGLFNIPAGSSIFLVISLLLLGSALRRRLRAALLLSVVWEALSAVLSAALFAVVAMHWNSLHTADPDHTRLNGIFALISAGTGVILALVLWSCRSAFPARLAPGSRLAAVTVLVGGLLLSMSVAIMLTEFFPNSLEGPGERIGWSIRAAVGDPAAIPVNGHVGHHWVAAVAGVLSAASVLAAAWTFLRSARAKQYLGADEELHVRRLLLEAGEGDSLGYFATRRDKSVIFSRDGRAAVTYRVLASVSLASADPIGHPAAWPAAIDAWVTEARSHGWFPAALSVSEPGARAYVAAGLKALNLGDEAIIDVDSFTLDGHAMRPVRQAVTRIQRVGYTVDVRRHGEIDLGELAQLADLAEKWRGEATERGFSMALNRLGDAADARCVMVTARDRTGELRGLLSFVPWGARGLSLDLMRRDRAAENGVIEFMVTRLVEACPTMAVRRVSLNFAMFRSIFSSSERIGAGPVVRLTDSALGFASRFWQIETLYRSNAKYLPTWVPRLMCFDSSLTLTRAAVAAGMAEGFLPSVRPRPRRAAADKVTVDGTEPLAFTEAVRRQEEHLLQAPRPRRSVTEQQRVRREKIARLAEAGQQAYPVSVARSATIAAVRADHPNVGPGESTGDHVAVAGRVRAVRDLGGVIFAVLQGDGAQVQAMLTADETPADAFALWKRAVDLGDLVSVSGEVVASRRGELSVLVMSWQMAAKCLRPLPDRHAGLSDPDALVRQRNLDLIVNPHSLATLQLRSRAVQAFRDGFVRRGFAEVETPMLHAVHGGAAARPFRTYSNAYNVELFLRIAPELYLKRLCVAGMGKIFELNRNFRNEGADSTHNPEFTSVEAYQAYTDYNDMRETTRELLLEVATAVHGSPVAVRPGTDGRPTRIDLTRPWPVITVHDAVSKAVGIPISPMTSCAQLHEICAAHKVRTPTQASAGDLVVRLYEQLVAKDTDFPTFYTDFPLESSPLTRRHREDPALAERWDLVAFGTEIGTAYSELIDPIDQRERLVEQSLRAAAGDSEAMQIDEPFLTALEYAMPPTGGLGIGVDRVVMMLTGAGIRSTLAFPFVRPQLP